MKRIIRFIFVLLIVYAASSAYAQSTLTRGNLIRVRFDQTAIDPADTLGYWYSEMAGETDSSVLYSQHLTVGGKDYFIFRYRFLMEGTDDWGFQRVSSGYYMAETLNSVNKIWLNGWGAYIEYYPFNLPERIQYIAANNGSWILSGYFGSSFVSNEGYYPEVKHAANLDSAYELQHIVGKVGNKYAVVFHNTQTYEYACFLANLDNSPMIDTIYNGRLFLSDSVTPEQITHLKDNFYLITTYSGFYNGTESNKLYILQGNEFKFIKSVPEFPRGIIRIEGNGPVFYCYNEVIPYSFTESDTSFTEEQIVPFKMESQDRDYKYGAKLTSDSIFVYNALTQEKLYSIYRNGIGGLSNVFIDSPYVYVHQTMSIIGTEDEPNIVSSYKLSAYPNPFNPTATIAFSIAKSGLVELNVYDILGRKVTSLLNEYRAAGSYEVKFNGANLPSGIYLYTLKAGSFAKTGKLMLIK